MSIQVSCACGKRFMTGDQYAGKRTKCPACGQALTIPAAAAAVKAPKPAAVASVPKAAPVVRQRPPSEPDDLMSLAESEEVFAPSSHPTTASVEAPKAKKSAAAGLPPLSKRNRETGPVATPRVSISPGIILLIILAILIPSAIYWAKNGPMKAQADWAKMSDPAIENINGQITRAIQQKYKEEGRDLTDIKFQPKATGAFFDSLGMMLSMPDNVSFQGTSTEGHFSGVFHPKTWRFETDVPLRTQEKLLHVTGSAKETDQSLEIDGKPVKD
jgi:hypothetical protein